MNILIIRIELNICVNVIMCKYENWILVVFEK
ncbi:hypothetical protein F383_34180 [Gossypium arboreum]|uniref:Uncharacterized protein n=1 Tax=Gossypium arboreum TaxID=29729 RepID=A0A0B0N715_GOSAR|nr:hypothetical protein F383_34180 [Gossypium arboreum]